MAVPSPSGLSVRSSRLRLFAEMSNWSTLTVMIAQHVFVDLELALQF